MERAQWLEYLTRPRQIPGLSLNLLFLTLGEFVLSALSRSLRCMNENANNVKIMTYLHNNSHLINEFFGWKSIKRITEISAAVDHE